MTDGWRCDGCGEEIDPLTCWCGEPVDAHGLFTGHGAVPMGCECYRREAELSGQE